MINIITYQIDGNKSKSNLSTHHQAYVCEGFLSEQPSHVFWSHQLFIHDWWTCTSHHEGLGGIVVTYEIQVFFKGAQKEVFSSI